jgi:hypothetical protein
MHTTARFYYRFVDSVGFGSCDNCYGIGPRNHLCLRCCVSEGMVVGSCFVCHHKGPAWEGCQWCEYGRCLVSGYGSCDVCEEYGTLGSTCENCGDGVVEPIPVDLLLDSAAEVNLQVVTPTTCFHHVIPVTAVASRTRSRTRSTALSL